MMIEYVCKRVSENPSPQFDRSFHPPVTEKQSSIIQTVLPKTIFRNYPMVDGFLRLFYKRLSVVAHCIEDGDTMSAHGISNKVSKETTPTKESPLEESQEEQARKKKQIQPLLN